MRHFATIALFLFAAVAGGAKSQSIDYSVIKEWHFHVYWKTLSSAQGEKSRTVLRTQTSFRKPNVRNN